MLRVDRRFTDLTSTVDDVHDLFEWWGADAVASGVLDDFRVEVVKLVIHEWIANLIQHASFGGEEPLITLALTPDGSRVHCVVEDNSCGFDFLQQVAYQQDHLDSAPEPPERGRGLLMIMSSTDNLSYRPAGRRRGAGAGEPRLQRLEFSVSPLSDRTDAAFDTGYAATDTYFDAPEYTAPDSVESGERLREEIE